MSYFLKGRNQSAACMGVNMVTASKIRLAKASSRKKARVIYRPATLQDLLAARITSSSDAVFTPADFSDLADYDQVLRVLRKLVQEDGLAKLGYGVYARVRADATTGRPILDVAGGFAAAVRAALTKLGVPWREAPEPLNARARLMGRRWRANAAFVVPKEFRRKLRFGDQEARYVPEQTGKTRDVIAPELRILYQEAMSRFGSECFWNMHPAQTPAGMKVVASQLRKYGGMDAWRLATKITETLNHSAG
ncbi:MAG: hypothetical protein K2Q10_06330 [Rhodospirillales bacterium]|nr:hypothetical protein [Rhodospirillales bacterium]